MFSETKKFLTRFKRDQKGIAWVIGVFVITLALMPVVFFPMQLAWDQVEGAITDNYTFTGSMASSFVVVNVTINYILVFGIIYSIAWAITNAKAKKYEP